MTFMDILVCNFFFLYILNPTVNMFDTKKIGWFEIKLSIFTTFSSNFELKYNPGNLILFAITPKPCNMYKLFMQGKTKPHFAFLVMLGAIH